MHDCFARSPPSPLLLHIYMAGPQKAPLALPKMLSVQQSAEEGWPLEGLILLLERRIRPLLALGSLGLLGGLGLFRLYLLYLQPPGLGGRGRLLRLRIFRLVNLRKGGW